MQRAIRWFFGAIGLGIATTGYAYKVERRWMEVVAQTIAIPGLPEEWKGVRILHFSDLHLGHYLGIEELEKVVDRINEQQPDLICFTGDLVDKSTRLLSSAIPILARLHAPLGKFAVLGNHDWRYGEQLIVRQALLDSGFSVLINEHIKIQKKEGALFVAGMDNALHGVPDPQKALNGISPEDTVILLVHEPDFAEEAVKHPFALQLSGHSHGGQVRLPFLGHLITPPMAQKYVQGLQYAGDGKLPVYTNRGIGTTILPVRLFCRPEITVLTLV
ncbi:metallophosphoesterase [Brevibacillus borstelensis]|uniref:metallophosphoesterase n=1 Tax=Brevibacillus borstelensis TaxID=45462 RepID=UPI0030BFFE95